MAADGADPKLLRQFLRDGTCPTLARLASRGFWCPLETTLPPVSPVAWTTFLTGCNPARHGVVDFFTKEPRQYRLALGLYRVAGGSPPQYVTRRQVSGLPSILREAGLRGYFLWLPGTFPPEPTLGGTLAGLGVPDALGSLGLSALYTDQPQAGRAAAVRDRRLVVPLEPQGEGRFRAPLLGASGPAGPVLWLTVEGGTLRIALAAAQDAELPPPTAALQPGAWTPWVHFPLERAGQPTLQAMARFKWSGVGSPLELYRTAVQHPPDAAPFPLSAPPSFAAEVAGWVGTYATLGLACDQNGLQLGVLDAESFLQDAWQTWEQRGRALHHLAERSDWSLAVGHLFVLDALQHLFWAETRAEGPGEAVRAGYAWLDRLAASLVEALGPEVTFLVVSDHGVLPLQKRVGLNRWLHQQGFLHLREGPKGPTVDWTRTQAASLGHGGIFLNVRGREPMGVVSPGRAYEALRAQLARELLAWRDPETGEAVVVNVWPREAVYQGPALDLLPDLALALYPGYGLDRQDMMGQVSPSSPPIQPRRGQWAAGHEGPYRPEDVPGVLLAAGPAVRPGAGVPWARLMDLAPTLLRALRLRPPDFMDGRVLEGVFL
ncbi:MAG: alkaline phosphatase family protein [Anaerolineae bacterium]